MTIGDLRDLIEELELADSTEIIFYDPVYHEALRVDSIEKGIFDPSKETFVEAEEPDDHTGIPCIALFI